MGDERRRLGLDGSALLEALVARDEGLLATYVDLTNGELVRLYDPAVTGRSNEGVHTKVDQEPERFAEVPRFTRSYRLMADFVDTVEDDHLARMLDTALTGRQAFRRFDAVLAGWPTERERWATFRRTALIHWAAAWLRSHQLEPDWELEVPPEHPAEVPEILQVAVSGQSIAQRSRQWSLPSEAEAARLFHRLARQLCELRGEPFGVRRLRSRTRFTRGGVELRRDGAQVILTIR